MSDNPDSLLILETSHYQLRTSIHAFKRVHYVIINTMYGIVEYEGRQLGSCINQINAMQVVLDQVLERDNVKLPDMPDKG